MLPVLLVDGNGVDVHITLEPPLLVRNLDVVTTHHPLPHEPVIRKCPVLEPIGPPPLAVLVVPFIPELHRDLYSCVSPTDSKSADRRGDNSAFLYAEKTRTHLIIRKCKELLSKTISVFLCPLFSQEVDDLISSPDEDVSVSPDRVGRVGHFHLLRVSEMC
jgi:hypothetical protein